MRLCYERRGNGPPLVLIHGIGHRWQCWLPVLDLLAESRDVIAIDLPGFGGTPMVPGRRVSIGALAETFAEICAELGVMRPHVAGNSLGGLLALELADRGLVRSATALSPAGFSSVAGGVYAIGVLSLHRAAGRLPPPLLAAVGRSPRLRAMAVGLLFARPRRVEWETVMADLDEFRAAPAFWPTVRAMSRHTYGGRPQVPVTIAWGVKDRILLPRQSRRALRLLPQARHIVLPGCGHIPMSDAPELVARVLLEGSSEPGRQITG